LKSVLKQHLSEISTIRKQTSTEHGEVYVQMKEHAYVHI